MITIHTLQTYVLQAYYDFKVDDGIIPCKKALTVCLVLFIPVLKVSNSGLNTTVTW